MLNGTKTVLNGTKTVLNGTKTVFKWYKNSVPFLSYPQAYKIFEA